MRKPVCTGTRSASRHALARATQARTVTDKYCGLNRRGHNASTLGEQQQAHCDAVQPLWTRTTAPPMAQSCFWITWRPSSRQTRATRRRRCTVATGIARAPSHSRHVRPRLRRCRARCCEQSALCAASACARRRRDAKHCGANIRWQLSSGPRGGCGGCPGLRLHGRCAAGDSGAGAGAHAHCHFCCGAGVAGARGDAPVARGVRPRSADCATTLPTTSGSRAGC